MAKPVSSYDWATDANYAADGTPTKVEPGAGLRAQGWERGERPAAQNLNDLLHAHGEWHAWEEGELDALDARFNVDGLVVLPASVQFTKIVSAIHAHPNTSGGVPDWDRNGDTIRSAADGGVAQWDVKDLLPNNASIVRARVLVQPGAARTGIDRVQVNLVKINYGVSFAAPVDTRTTITSAYDDGTANLQWILLDLSGSPEAVGADVWEVQVIAGVDGGTSIDVAAAVEAEFSSALISNN